MAARKRTIRTTEHGRRVIGYVRVSTDEQVESGAGLAAQRSAIAAECSRRGWKLAALLEDAGASGGSMRGRPGLHCALETIEAGRADALVVAKLDRLSRSLLDFASLMDRSRRCGWSMVRARASSRRARLVSRPWRAGWACATALMGRQWKLSSSVIV